MFIYSGRHHNFKYLIEVEGMRKKTKIISVLAGLLAMPSVLADYGGMMGYGYGMMQGVWMGIYGILWFVTAAFVFSAVFWYLYKLIVKENFRPNNKR